MRKASRSTFNNKIARELVALEQALAEKKPIYINHIESAYYLVARFKLHALSARLVDGKVASIVAAVDPG